MRQKQEIPKSPSDIQESVVKKKTIEKDQRGTRAFKPARIPSPIYGFKERPDQVKDDAQVEFELTPLEKKVPFTGEPLHIHAQQVDEISVLEKNSVIPNESKFTEYQEVDLDQLEMAGVNGELQKGVIKEDVQVDLVATKDVEVMEEILIDVVEKDQLEIQIEEVEEVVEDIQMGDTTLGDLEVSLESESDLTLADMIEEEAAENGGTTRSSSIP